MPLSRLVAVFALAVALLPGAAAQAPDLSWEPLPGPFGGSATGIASLPGGQVAVATFEGDLYRTQDGGAAWARVPLGRTNLGEVVATPDGDLWALGAPLLRSTDGGRTWAPAAPGLSAARPGVDLALRADGVLYAALGANGLYRTPATTFVAGEAAVPTAVLGLDAWPNPARGGASVTLTLGEPAEARVAVYDALGRRVALLHDGAAAGTLTVRTGALAPGVYVVRATAGAQTRTRRLVVVR